MPPSRLIPFVLGFQLTLFFSSSIAMAKSMSEMTFPTSTESIALSVEHLTSKLLQNPIYQPEIYIRAVTILDSLESSPSCHRKATLNLIDSCQSLEASTVAETSINEVRQEYATQLAVCELTGAKVDAPKECHALLPFDQNCRHDRTSRGLFTQFRREKNFGLPSGSSCNMKPSRKHILDCLNALHSRPQWWTSYSNALQNVVVICQASRGAVEKDEMLQLFRTSAEVSKDITAALEESINRAKDFSTAAQALQASMLQTWEDHTAQSRNLFGQLLLSIRNAVHTMLDSMNEGSEQATQKLVVLSNDIDNNRLKVLQTEGDLDRLHTNYLQRTESLAANQMESWNKVVDRANGVSNSLHSVMDADIPALQHFLQDYLEKLRNFTDLLSHSNAALESHIIRNNEKLEHQTELISRVDFFHASDNITKLAILFILTSLLQSFNPSYVKFFALLAAFALVLTKVSRILFILYASRSFNLPTYAFSWNQSYPNSPILPIVAIVLVICGITLIVVCTYGSVKPTRSDRNNMTLLGTDP